MKFSFTVPSQDLQDESGLGALDFEVSVSAVSNSKSEKRKPYPKWSSQERFIIGKYAAINGPTAPAAVAAAKKMDQRADQSKKVPSEGFVLRTKQS